MKKIVKKVLAFVLAMTLCISQLALPALADSTTPDPNAGGNLPTPQALNPNTPLPEAPADSYDSDYQQVTNPDGTVTETLKEEWTKSETTTDTPQTQNPDANTNVDTTGNTIVTKDGEQTTTTNYGPDSSWQYIEGEEDINTTDTNKTVTTEENVEMTNTNETPVDGKKDSDTTGFGEYNATGNQTDNENKEADDWTEVSGTREQIGQTTSETIAVPNPGEVTLNMTQTSANPDTDVKKFTKDIDEILPSEGFQADGSKWDPNDQVTMDGEKWTVSYDEKTIPDPNDSSKTITVVTGVTFTRVVSSTTGDVTWDYNNAPDFADQSGAQPTTTTLTQTNYLPVTPGYEDVDEGDGTKVTVSLPEVTDYTPGTYTTDANGNKLLDSMGREVTRTIEAIVEKDANGNNVTTGYRIIDTVKDTSNAGVDTVIKPTETKEIPAYQPTAKAPVTSGGLTTTETVTSFTDANGKTAWRLTTVITEDATGKELYRETHDYFAGTSTTNETIVTTPTSDERVITTETVVKGNRQTQLTTREIDGTSTNTRTLEAVEYNLVEYDDGIYLMYEGYLYKVIASGNHGDLTMNSLQPQSSLIVGGKTGSYSSSTDLREPASWTNPIEKVPGMEWQYLDYGLESRFRVDTGSGGDGTLAHQFILKDSEGNTQYVYCADFGTSAVFGASYDMDNISNSTYFDRNGDGVLSDEEKAQAEHMEVIALNCFWGTKEGERGSLEWVQNILLEAKKANPSAYSNISEEDIKNLTEGQALTASQAALWYYGNSNGVNQLGSDVAGKAASGSMDSTDEKMINAMYKALLGLSPTTTENTTTELLNADNFATEASITVKEKVVNSQTNEVVVGINGGDTYVTDVAVTMDVAISSLTGNLVLTLKVPDGNGGFKEVAKANLRTDDSNLLGYIGADGVADDSRSTYTFENVQLEEGINFTLTVTGTQELKTGAYMYSAAVYSDSQTFVGVASGEREVNLAVEMKFTVTDPSAQVTTTKERWNETDTDTHKRIEEGEKIKDSIETETTVNIKTLVKGTKVSTKMVTEKIREERNWNSYIEYLYTTVWDEDGGNRQNEEDETIFDEAVPLAAAPKTGDASQILAVVCLISLGCAWMLSRKKARF